LLTHGLPNIFLTTPHGSLAELSWSTGSYPHWSRESNAMDCECVVDKLRVADNMRRHLRRRLAFLLDVKPEELPKMKLGTMVHLLFAFAGDTEELGGFNTTITGILQILGRDVVWADPSEPADEEAKPAEQAVIN
jgi:hypothetical protein